MASYLAGTSNMMINSRAAATSAIRIKLRMKSSSKRLIERAASFEGKTVSHFIMTRALEQAEKTVQKHETMTLNTKNSRVFFEALTAPVLFNRKLAAALEEHDQRVVSK